MKPEHAEMNRLSWRVEKQWARRRHLPDTKTFRLRRVLDRVRAFVSCVRTTRMSSAVIRAGIRRLTRELEGV